MSNIFTLSPDKDDKDDKFEFSISAKNIFSNLNSTHDNDIKIKNFNLSQNKKISNILIFPIKFAMGDENEKKNVSFIYIEQNSCEKILIDMSIQHIFDDNTIGKILKNYNETFKKDDLVLIEDKYIFLCY